MLSRSKLDAFLYSLQSGPKDVIIVQFHSAVKKIDEFLFSTSFHLRSVELHERLVDWDSCINWMRTNSNCRLIRDKKINLGVSLSCQIHSSFTNTHKSDDWGTKPHKPFAVLILQQCVRTVWHTLALRGLEDPFFQSCCCVVSVFGSGGKKVLIYIRM